MPASSSSTRSGEDGLKNGPSVCAKVASSPSWHAGVSASCACAAPLLMLSSEPAAKAPAPSTARRVGVSIMSSSTPVAEASAHRLQFVDHAGDDRKSAIPEFGILGIEPERFQQLGIMLGAAGGEHVEITLGKAFRCILVDRIERVHQTIAERIGVDIKRRMDEVRDVHPEILVARLDLDRRSKAFALHTEPDFADTLRGHLAVLALGVDRALESIERDLPHHGVDHVLDLAGEQRLPLFRVFGLRQQ